MTWSKVKKTTFDCLHQVSLSMELISRYFPDLTTAQQQQFAKLQALYEHWNNLVNVISRKDMGNLYERHVLHSLGIAKVQPFLSGTHVLDVGTGGGFPGVPLAILFPETHFHLIDSIGKKIMVIQKVVEALQIKNVKAEQVRAEYVQNKSYDFVVSRAVSRLSTFYEWVRWKFRKTSHHPLQNGLLYLKGGDLSEEIKESRLKGIRQYSLSAHFKENFFETKKVIYVPAFKNESLSRHHPRVNN